MDYPLQLPNQLQQLLKSLRKSRKLTQAQLAKHLGVVQSRVADIERDPGAVSVEQLLQVLAILGAQVVVRETEPSASRPSIDLEAHATASGTASATLTTGSTLATQTADAAPGEPPGDTPRGKW